MAFLACHYTYIGVITCKKSGKKRIEMPFDGRISIAQRPTYVYKSSANDFQPKGMLFLTLQLKKNLLRQLQGQE